MITSNLPFTSSFTSACRSFSQQIRDETMVADGRTFFCGFSRRLGAVPQIYTTSGSKPTQYSIGICYSIGTKANQTLCASGVCQGRRNTGNDASAPELPAQGSDGAHGPVYEGPDTHVTSQDQLAGHGTRSTQEGEHFSHARIWHRLWGISEPFPIPSLKPFAFSLAIQAVYNGRWV